MSMTTTEPINWLHSLDEAREKAQSEKKMVFIELFSPKCWGCQNTEERTFPDETVQRLIEENFVPVHFDVLNHPEHLKEFKQYWTPTFLFFCPDDNLHRKAVGFLPPQEFIGELLLAPVNYAMARGDWDEAHQLAQKAVEGTAGDELRHSEALYWQAVAAYKSSDDQQKLVEGWKDLVNRYPNSEWAMKCDFVRDA